jgi:hypothetical protein
MTYLDFWADRFSKSSRAKQTTGSELKWKNVHRDGLPLDGQQVLLSADGVYHCTTFDAARQIFRLRDEPDSFFAVADNAVYHWVGIDPLPVADPHDQG